jgi:hypothetical protein
MRLVHHKQRNDQRRKGLRIAISQAEITADLHYRGGSRQVREAQSRSVGGR